MQGSEILEHTATFGEAVPIADSFNLVLWLLLLFNLITIALVKTLNPGYIQNLFVTIIYNRQLANNLREDLNFSRTTSFLLNLTYFNALAIVVWKITGLKNELLILAFLGGLIGIVILKLIAIRLLGYLFNSMVGLQEHLLGHYIFFQIGGLVLTPLIIFTHFLPSNLSNGVILMYVIFIVLFILLREIQSFVRAFQYKISVFYIILYLCTLEILPLMVGFRVFTPINGVLN